MMRWVKYYGIYDLHRMKLDSINMKLTNLMEKVTQLRFSLAISIDQEFGSSSISHCSS